MSWEDLLVAVAAPGMEVHLTRPACDGSGTRIRLRLRCGTDGLERARRLHAAHDDLRVALAFHAPGRRIDPLGARVLWVHADTGKRVAALDRFRLAPSFRIRLGRANVWGVWELDRSLPFAVVERGNRKLAYHLGCVMSRGVLDAEVPVPGTVLREGRSRGLLVREEAGGDRVYGRELFNVVRRLKDAPDPDAWRDR